MISLVPKRLLIPLAFLAFVSLGLPDTLLGVAWPSMRATFGRPIEALGVLSTLATAGYLASSLVAGSLLDRLGVGRILALSGAAVTLSLAGYAVAPAWPLLFGCAVLAGLGAGAIDSAMNLFAARAFSARVTNWLHACWGVGATVGPLVMTAALRGRFGWRLGYAIVAVATAGLTVLFIATRRMWRLDPGDAAVASPADRPTLRAAIRRPPVALHALFFLVYGGVEFGCGNWLFTLLTDARGERVAAAGRVVGLYWFAVTIGRVAFGQVTASLGGAAVVRIGLVGATFGAAALLPGVPRVAALAAPALIGFAIAPVFPTMISLTPARVGDRFAPQSVSLQGAACALGIGGGSAGIGLLARRFGIDVLPVVLLAALATLALLHEAIDRAADVRPLTTAR